MPSTFRDMAAAPANTAVMALCTVIWFFMWNRRVGFEEVSISYTRVVRDGQYYRALTAALTHLDVLHILFNMATLWSVCAEEAVHGSVWYLVITTQLLLVSKALWIGIVYVLIHYGGRPGAADQQAVGYSGVIFGWIALMVAENPRGSASIMGMVDVPRLLYPVAMLLVTQLLIRRASFIGHLAGMLAGFAIGWGALAWMGYFWWGTVVLMAAGIMLLSLKANSNLAPRWLRWVQVSPEYAASGPWLLLGCGGRGGADGAEGGTGASAPTRRYMDGGVLHVSRGGAVDVGVDVETGWSGPTGGRVLGGRGGAAAQPSASNPSPPPAALATQEGSNGIRLSSGGDAGASGASGGSGTGAGPV
jgi:membrane associated rhomboid family serine protease